MSVLSWIILISSIAQLFLGYYIFFKNPRQPLNRVFLAYSLVNSIFLGFPQFAALQVESADAALLWLKVMHFFPLYQALTLHFILVYTEKAKIFKIKFLLYLFLYLPAFFIIYLEFSTSLIYSGIVKEYWGYANKAADSWVHFPLLIWIITTQSIVPIILLVTYYKKSSKRIKKQTLFIGISILIPTIIGFLTMGIFPVLKIYIPPVDALTTLIIMIIIVYAIWKYEAFVLTPATAAENILATMPDGVILTDMEMKIVAVNKALLNLLGYKEAELKEKHISILFEFIEKIKKEKKFTALFQEEYLYNIDISFKTKSGERMPGAISVSLIKDKDGENVGAVGIARDTREIKKYQTQILHSEKIAAVGRLTTGIAHEMNTPLAAIRTSIMNMGDLINEYKESINNPNVVLNDHLSIIKDMYSSMDTAKQSAEKCTVVIRNIKSQTIVLEDEIVEKFNANDIINDAISSLAFLLTKHNCKVEMQLSEPVYIYGKKHSINQIVINLVTNSIEAGSNLISLHISDKDKEMICITIADNGCGISPENISRLYDPFFTTKPFGKSLGIGLTITHELVSEMRGNIQVLSDPGNTRFIITFPKNNN